MGKKFSQQSRRVRPSCVSVYVELAIMCPRKQPRDDRKSGRKNCRKKENRKTLFFSLKLFFITLAAFSQQ